MSERKIPITASQSRLFAIRLQQVAEVQRLLQAELMMALAAAEIEGGQILRVETDPPVIVLGEADVPNGD